MRESIEVAKLKAAVKKLHINTAVHRPQEYTSLMVISALKKKKKRNDMQKNSTLHKGLCLNIRGLQYELRVI